MSHAEWAALPYWLRLWRVLTCSHPFDQSHLVGRVFDPSRDHVHEGERWRFVCNVRECGRCRGHFLDCGLVSPEFVREQRL